MLKQKDQKLLRTRTQIRKLRKKTWNQQEKENLNLSHIWTLAFELKIYNVSLGLMIHVLFHMYIRTFVWMIIDWKTICCWVQDYRSNEERKFIIIYEMNDLLDLFFIDLIPADECNYIVLFRWQKKQNDCQWWRLKVLCIAHTIRPQTDWLNSKWINQYNSRCYAKRPIMFLKALWISRSVWPLNRADIFTMKRYRPKTDRKKVS